jgi:Fe-S-cluster containining protein
MKMCAKCGSCCKVLAIRVPLSDQVYHEFFSARGLKTDDDDPEVVLIPSICQYLTVKNECSIYNVRPEFCRTFPRGNSYLPVGCVWRARDQSTT